MEVSCESKYKFTFLFASIFVHSLGFLLNSIAVFARMYYSVNKPSLDYFAKFGYALKYVNTLNALVQSVYNFVALIVDITINCSYTLDAPPVMMTARSVFRSTIAVPLGMVNFTIFWTMNLTNPELLGRPDYPLWLQHLSTTLSPIILFFDVICCKGNPTNLIFGFFVISIVSFVYYVWLHIIYYFTNTWAVPFIRDFVLPQKVALYFFFLLLKYLYFIVGIIFNNILWCEDFVRKIPFLRTVISEDSRGLINPAKKKTIHVTAERKSETGQENHTNSTEN